MLENAVKHNRASAEEPLELAVSLHADDAAAPAIRAVNALRPRRSALPSASVGLANLAARCGLVTGATLAVGPAATPSRSRCRCGRPHEGLHRRGRAAGARAADRDARARRVACFLSVDKLTFAVLPDGRRYQVETPLGDLQEELDPAQFFRANRRVLIAAHAVQRFAAAGKGRLRVEATAPAIGEVTVSQDRAAAFRAWLGG